MKPQYGLIGNPLEHSFSKEYFTKKFKKEHIEAEYLNFELKEISELPELWKEHPALVGLNVTIPFKEEVMEYLDDIDEVAKEIRAVNVLKLDNGKVIGYNTDYIGFQKSLEKVLKPEHQNALILGTGGVSQAVDYVLKQLEIPYRKVSRDPSGDYIGYKQLTDNLVSECTLIINCTPLGTYPHEDECPPIPYEGITDKHLLFDMVYNPAETEFMKQGKKAGAETKNGREMLEIQAEEAWKIWNS